MLATCERAFSVNNSNKVKSGHGGGQWVPMLYMYCVHWLYCRAFLHSFGSVFQFTRPPLHGRNRSLKNQTSPFCTTACTEGSDLRDFRDYRDQPY